MKIAAYGNVKNATIIVQLVLVELNTVVNHVKEISTYMIIHVLTHVQQDIGPTLLLILVMNVMLIVMNVMEQEKITVYLVKINS